MEPVTYSKLNFSEATAQKILPIVSKVGIDQDAADAATAFCKAKLADLRFSDSKLDGFAAMERVASAFPAAASLMFKAMCGGITPSTETADFYSAEG
jgi:hypothetical protein